MSQLLSPTGPILGMALALACAGAATAQTDTVMLSGFEDFSGGEVQLTFDDLGSVNGDDVAQVDVAEFSLSAGGPAKYFEDAFPRESGPAGTGSINNFWGFTSPYPDLEILFAGPMHRIAFEVRANDLDDVAVSLLSNGEPIDEVVVPSRGSDAFYFYGYENEAGFDGVRVDVVANASGAFSLDNLTYESFGGETPPPEETEELPVFACEGFRSIPPARDRGPRRFRPPFRALVARLTDAEGNVVSAEQLPEAPAVRVMFTPEGGDESVDVTQEVVWARAGAFAPIRRGRWMAWLLDWRMREPGLYLTTLESGDASTYTIDPVCADWTWNDAPARHPHRWHRRGRR